MSTDPKSYVTVDVTKHAGLPVAPPYSPSTRLPAETTVQQGSDMRVLASGQYGTPAILPLVTAQLKMHQEGCPDCQCAIGPDDLLVAVFGRQGDKALVCDACATCNHTLEGKAVEPDWVEIHEKRRLYYRQHKVARALGSGQRGLLFFRYLGSHWGIGGKIPMDGVQKRPLYQYRPYGWHLATFLCDMNLDDDRAVIRAAAYAIPKLDKPEGPTTKLQSIPLGPEGPDFAALERQTLASTGIPSKYIQAQGEPCSVCDGRGSCPDCAMTGCPDCKDLTYTSELRRVIDPDGERRYVCAPCSHSCYKTDGTAIAQDYLRLPKGKRLWYSEHDQKVLFFRFLDQHWCIGAKAQIDGEDKRKLLRYQPGGWEVVAHLCQMDLDDIETVLLAATKAIPNLGKPEGTRLSVEVLREVAKHARLAVELKAANARTLEQWTKLRSLRWQLLQDVQLPEGWTWGANKHHVPFPRIEAVIEGVDVWMHCDSEGAVKVRRDPHIHPQDRNEPAPLESVPKIIVEALKADYELKGML